MSKLLLLYGYNNYFNRIIKREESFADYKAVVGTGNFAELNDTNFSVTDGVNARHVFNTSAFLDEKSPDYLVRDYNGELQRWFVLEAVKIMGNQIQLSLRRDIIADYYSEVKTAPAFIQKGMLQYDSPLIFNKENLTYNQIKKKEILLKDFTNCAWVVGYIARGETLDEEQEIVGYTDEDLGNYYTDYEDLPTAVTDLIENQTLVTNIKRDKINFDFFTHWYRGENEVFRIKTKRGFWSRIVTDGISIISASVISNESSGATDRNRLCLDGYPNRKPEYILDPAKSVFEPSDIANGVSSLFSLNNYNFDNYDGQYVKKEGKLYKIKAVKMSTTQIDKDYNMNNLDTDILGIHSKTFLDNLINSNENIFSDERVPIDRNAKVVGIHANLGVYRLDLVETELYKVKTKISNSHTTSDVTVERNRASDAPYDMFAIPYKTIKLTLQGNTSLQNVNGEISLAIARGFKEQLPSVVYDIQILPYCPCPEMIQLVTSHGINPITYPEVKVESLVEHRDFEYIREYNTNRIVSVMLFPTHSSVTHDIAMDLIANPELNIATDAIERKIDSETRSIRIVSPNYNGIFEFSEQKNNGVPTMNIDVNFKPYTPYIHVSPVFNGLYGQDFNDARGLICGGDFSISTSYSQWEEYQINNKNYENIFNRQIQNIDVNNSIAMEKTSTIGIVSAFTAGISGATGGGIAGSVAGPYGAAAGAVVGGVSGFGTSLFGASKDVELLAKQQSENRSYATDMYTYQLGNIQALPYSLSKVSTFNENNKIFPFIEIYECTDVEKQNLRDKIKYNGMTVMVQGKIEDYIDGNGSYIQAQLIRLEGIKEDNHLITELYNELMKGVYIYERDTETN